MQSSEATAAPSISANARHFSQPCTPGMCFWGWAGASTACDIACSADACWAKASRKASNRNSGKRRDMRREWQSTASPVKRSNAWLAWRLLCPRASGPAGERPFDVAAASASAWLTCRRGPLTQPASPVLATSSLARQAVHPRAVAGRGLGSVPVGGAARGDRLWTGSFARPGATSRSGPTTTACSAAL